MSFSVEDANKALKHLYPTKIDEKHLYPTKIDEEWFEVEIARLKGLGCTNIARDGRRLEYDQPMRVWVEPFLGEACEWMEEYGFESGMDIDVVDAATVAMRKLLMKDVVVHQVRDVRAVGEVVMEKVR